jgi:hypothetical protein
MPNARWPSSADLRRSRAGAERCLSVAPEGERPVGGSGRGVAVSPGRRDGQVWPTTIVFHAVTVVSLPTVDGPAPAGSGRPVGGRTPGGGVSRATAPATSTISARRVRPERYYTMCGPSTVDWYEAEPRSSARPNATSMPETARHRRARGPGQRAAAAAESAPDGCRVSAEIRPSELVGPATPHDTTGSTGGQHGARVSVVAGLRLHRHRLMGEGRLVGAHPVRRAATGPQAGCRRLDVRPPSVAVTPAAPMNPAAQRPMIRLYDGAWPLPPVSSPSAASGRPIERRTLSVPRPVPSGMPMRSGRGTLDPW